MIVDQLPKKVLVDTGRGGVYCLAENLPREPRGLPLPLRLRTEQGAHRRDVIASNIASNI